MKTALISALAAMGERVVHCHGSFVSESSHDVEGLTLHNAVGASSSYPSEEPYYISAEKYHDKYFRDLSANKKVKAKKNKKKYQALRDDNLVVMKDIVDDYDEKYRQASREYANNASSHSRAYAKCEQWQDLASALYHDGPFEAIKKPYIDHNGYKGLSPASLQQRRYELQYLEAERQAQRLAPANVNGRYFSLLRSQMRIEKLLGNLQEESDALELERLQDKLDRARYKHNLRIEALIQRKWKAARELGKMYQDSRDKYDDAMAKSYAKREKNSLRYDTWKDHLKQMRRRKTEEEKYYTNTWPSNPTSPVNTPYQSESESE